MLQRGSARELPIAALQKDTERNTTALMETPRAKNDTLLELVLTQANTYLHYC